MNRVEKPEVRRHFPRKLLDKAVPTRHHAFHLAYYELKIQSADSRYKKYCQVRYHTLLLSCCCCCCCCRCCLSASSFSRILANMSGNSNVWSTCTKTKDLTPWQIIFSVAICLIVSTRHIPAQNLYHELTKGRMGGWGCNWISSEPWSPSCCLNYLIFWGNFFVRITPVHKPPIQIPQVQKGMELAPGYVVLFIINHFFKSAMQLISKATLQ